MRWFIVILLAAVATAHAQDTSGGGKKLPLIEGRMDNAVQPRTGGPLLCDLRIIYRGKEVLRGPLQLRVGPGRETQWVMLTPEVVIAPGENVVRVTLPSMQVGHREEAIEGRAVLLTEAGEFDLGPLSMRAPIDSERSLTIGVVDPLGRTGGRHGELLKTLFLEQYRPSVADPFEARTLSTGPSATLPERMPIDPLALTAYDLLLLTPEGFSQLNGSQLQAIAAWVRAGGSACVITGGGMAERHATFLNACLGPREEAGEENFLLDASGAVTLSPKQPDAGHSAHHAAFGRLVVVYGGGPEDMLETDGWKRAALHLWKVRATQADHIITHGKWDPKQEERPERANRYYGPQYQRPGEQPFRIEPLPTVGAAQLLPALMPPSVQVVPFWVVVGILVLFALAVGPGDYLLLGALKQRKLTWIVFPAIAIAFTVLTVVVADHYMGSTDHRRALEIVDVDSAGNELRRTRIELLFTAKQRDINSDLQQAIMTPLSTDELGREGQYYDPYREPDMDVGSPSRIIGRMPSRYQFSQRVRQWTAQINRVTSIPAEPKKVDVPAEWQSLDQAALNSRSSAVFPKVSMLSDFLTQATSRQREGFFSIVSQVSPTGGSSFEDLAFIDDPIRQKPMAAVVVEDDTVIVYRRLHPRNGAR